jgi:membrane protease YdiL (CAAX protease family)
MSTRLDSPGTVHPQATIDQIQPHQLSRGGIAAVWAAAALPMAAAMWLVGPFVAHRWHTSQALTKSLIVGLTAALVWQFVLVVALVAAEQRTLRWSTVRHVLWLRSPKSPTSGRVGGRLWLLVVPLIVGVGIEQFIPSLPHPASRDFGAVLSSTSGQQFLIGSWGWFAVLVAMFVFNTVLGEELLFRGYLLPRMHGAFGDRDWVANGILFAGYHLHVPWAMPAILLDTCFLTGPTKRYRSALMGIAVHSAQSVFLTIAALAVVLK